MFEFNMSKYVVYFERSEGMMSFTIKIGLKNKQKSFATGSQLDSTHWYNVCASNNYKG